MVSATHALGLRGRACLWHPATHQSCRASTACNAVGRQQALVAPRTGQNSGMGGVQSTINDQGSRQAVPSHQNQPNRENGSRQTRPSDHLRPQQQLNQHPPSRSTQQTQQHQHGQQHDEQRRWTPSSGQRDQSMQEIFDCKNVEEMANMLDIAVGTTILGTRRLASSSRAHTLRLPHFTAMLARMPKLKQPAFDTQPQPQQARPGGRGPAVTQQLLLNLIRLVDSQLPELSTRGLCNCLWAVCRLEPNLEDQQELQNLRVILTRWMATACSMKHIESNTVGQQVCNLAYSLARLTSQGLLIFRPSEPPEQVKAGSAAGSGMTKNSAQDRRSLSYLEWSSEAPSERWWPVVANRCKRLLSSMTPTDLSITAWSLGHAGYADDRPLITRLCKQLTSELHSLKQQELSNVLWALASLTSSTIPTSSSIDTGSLQLGSAQELNEATQELFAAATVLLREDTFGDHWRAQHVANVLWALSTFKLTYFPDAWSDGFPVATHPVIQAGPKLAASGDRHAVSHIGWYSPAELSMLSWARARLSGTCSAELLTAINQDVQWRPSQHPPQNLACFVHAAMAAASDSTGVVILPDGMHRRSAGGGVGPGGSLLSLGWLTEDLQDNLVPSLEPLDLRNGSSPRQQQCGTSSIHAAQAITRTAWELLLASLKSQGQGKGHGQGLEQGQTGSEAQVLADRPAGNPGQGVMPDPNPRETSWRSSRSPFKGQEIAGVMLAACRLRVVTTSEVTAVAAALKSRCTADVPLARQQLGVWAAHHVGSKLTHTVKVSSGVRGISGPMFSEHDLSLLEQVCVVACCGYVSASQPAMFKVVAANVRQRVADTEERATELLEALRSNATGRPALRSPTMRFQHVADAMWAFGRTNLQDAQLYHSLASTATVMLQLFVEHAAGSSTRDASPLPPGFTPTAENLLCLSRGMAGANYYNATLVAVMAQAARRIMHNCSVADLVKLATTFAHADFYDFQLFEELAESALASMDEMSALSVGNLLWSYANLNIYHARLFKSALKRLSILLHDSAAHGVPVSTAARTLWACAVLHHQDWPRTAHLFSFVWAAGGAQALMSNERHQAYFAYVSMLIDSHQVLGLHGKSMDLAAEGSNIEQLEAALDQLHASQSVTAGTLNTNSNSNSGRVHMSPKRAPPLIPVALRPAWADSWLALRTNNQICSDFHTNVFSMLQRMGCSPQMEFPVLGGIFFVDIICDWKGKRVAMEVDGVRHFARNVPHHALGFTVARNRCLLSLGLNLACVHWAEWESASRSDWVQQTQAPHDSKVQDALSPFQVETAVVAPSRSHSRGAVDQSVAALQASVAQGLGPRLPSAWAPDKGSKAQFLVDSKAESGRRMAYLAQLMDAAVVKRQGSSAVTHGKSEGQMSHVLADMGPMQVQVQVQSARRKNRV